MEGLRGVAVTLVFLQHYTVQCQLIGLAPGWTASFASVMRAYGNMGVELFFVLSGFLIYGTLVRRRPGFVPFMTRRIVRIYPAFLVVFGIALAIPVVLPLPSKLPADPWAAAGLVGANLALLPGLFPIARIVEVAWSLSYEMFFYLVTAALVLGAGLGRAGQGARVAVLAWTLALFMVACWLDIPGVPVRMLPFFAGMLLAEGAGRHVPAWLGWTAPAVAFALGVCLHLGALWIEVMHTAAFFCLCGVCFRDAGRISAAMTWAPLRWLGNMSYSYYLLHGFVVQAAMLILRRLLPDGMPDWAFWTALAPVFSLTLAASAVLFLVIEKPVSLRPPQPRKLQAAA